MDLYEKDYIIKTIPNKYNVYEMKSIGRRLDIPETDFFVQSLTPKELSERLVNRICQLSKINEFKLLVSSDDELKRLDFFELYQPPYLTRPLDNSRVVKFGNFFTVLLKELDNLEEKDFEESELILPRDFEDKMRYGAKLNEDIIQAGFLLKNDIVSLRKRAKALDYNKYGKLLQKIGRIYRNIICNEYPEDSIESSVRFRKLYNFIYDNVPKDIQEDYDELDEYIEGLIFDTIAHCLIFNQ